MYAVQAFTSNDPTDLARQIESFVAQYERVGPKRRKPKVAIRYEPVAMVYTTPQSIPAVNPNTINIPGPPVTGTSILYTALVTIEHDSPA